MLGEEGGEEGGGGGAAFLMSLKQMLTVNSLHFVSPLKVKNGEEKNVLCRWQQQKSHLF